MASAGRFLTSFTSAPTTATATAAVVAAPAAVTAAGPDAASAAAGVVVVVVGVGVWRALGRSARGGVGSSTRPEESKHCIRAYNTIGVV